MDLIRTKRLSATAKWSATLGWPLTRPVANGGPMRSVLQYDAAHEGAKKNTEQAERMLKGLQVRQQKQGRYSPGPRRRYSEMSMGFELARDDIVVRIIRIS